MESRGLEMTKRKLTVKMMVEETKLQEIVDFLLNTEHHWMEINIGNKERRGSLKKK